MSTTSSRDMEALSKVLLDLAAKAKSATDRIAGDSAVDYHDQQNRHIILPKLPNPMGLDEAAARLMALAARDAQVFSIHEQLPGLPYDAAHAFVQVIIQRYGWAETKSATKQGFFGPYKTKPDMVRVRTGAGPRDYVEVPVGDFELPDISGKITAGFEGSNKNPRMSAYYLSAEVKFADREIIMDLISETVKYMANNSIYRGKAMKLKVDDKGNIETSFEPEFVDFSHVEPSDLVHPRDTEKLLSVNLWTPLQKTALCRKHKVPLKRTILLHGPYGTGKTLTAAVTAKIGLSNGWTFVSVENVKGLQHALEFATQYQPAVVFAEDVDRFASERDEKTNDLMNTISGILPTGTEVIVVLTTNHIENIHPAMMRPGRMDAIIPIGLPDADAAERLIRNYSGALLRHDTNVSAVAKSIDGFIPAMIHELVKRAKLSMMQEGRDTLSLEDMETAAIGLKAHAALLAPKAEDKSVEQKFGEAARQLLNGHGEKIDKIENFCEKFSSKYL